MAIAGLVETTTGAAVDADTRYPLTTSNVLLTSDERAGLSLVAITESNPPVTAATRQTPTVELGEGTALVIPAEHASYRAAITADAATLTLTPPASGSVEITALVRSRTVGQSALSIDTEDAYFGVSLDADTYARTAYLLIGGADVEGELTLALSDDSAADVVIPLTCVGTEWRRVAVSYRAGAAAQTLDITWAQTSATGALYWQSVAVEGPAPDAGSALLTAALQAAPSRVDLTATGRTDWALWGRTDASTIDRKAGVTAQIGTLGVTGDTAARVASAGSTWAFEDAAPAISQELTLAGVAPFWGCGGTPVDLIPAGGLVRLWAEVFADGSATVDAAVYLPTAATTAPPRLTTIAITPVQVQLATGTTQQFTAAGYDQYGDSFTLAGGTWAVSAGGSISSSGLFTASAVGGPYAVSYTEAGAIGAPIQGTAAVTVSAASGTGLLQASYELVADSTVVNLTAEGPDDWVHLGLADADDRNEQSGSTLIGAISRLGDGTSGRWYGAGVQPKWSWSDGDPTASEAGTYGYWDITLSSADTGDGWSGSIAANTNEHVATFWVRAYQTTGALNLSLSDGSDQPLSVVLGDLSATKYYKVPVTYRADSAAQTLDWEWVQTVDPGNLGLAAIAVTVGTDPIALTSIDWTPAAITMDEGAQTSAVAVALDQYNRPMVGTSLDLSVGAGVTATPDPVISGAQVTITAGATAVGSYTLAASNGVITGNLGITVEDYVTPTEYPEIALDTTALQAAYTAPYYTYTSAGWPQRSYTWLMLAIAARLGPAGQSPTPAQCANRLIGQIDYFLTGNNFALDSAFGTWGGLQGNHSLSIGGFAIAILRQTDWMWELVPEALKSKIDWYMRLAAYSSNMFINADHNQGRNKVTLYRFHVNSTNPNQNTQWPDCAASLMYWGGLSGYNAITAAFSGAALDAAIAQYGWTRLAWVWQSAEVRGALNAGTSIAGYGDATGYTNTYHADGVRRPLVSARGYQTGDPADRTYFGSLVDPAAPIAVTLPNLWQRFVDEFAVNKTALDTGAAINMPCPTKGHIRPGYTSPYLGEAVMDLEYDLPSRSNQHYACTNALHQIAWLATMRALGYFPTETANETMALRYKKAAAIFAYRVAAGWSDGRTGNCDTYNFTGNTAYWASQYWPTIKAKIIDDLTLQWPSNA